MENDERNGMTLGDLLRAVVKKIWIVLIATLVTAIVAGLCVQLLINPAKTEYSLEFTLIYPGRAQLKYPDGAPFYEQDLVSAEMLERAKAMDERLGGVDVNEMVSKDKISITANGWGSFTLRAAQSCFENREVATVFLKAVAAAPLELVKERAAKSDYHLSENVYGSAYSFRDRIELLSAQRTRMIAQYDSWISLYDNGFLISGKPLKNYRADMEVVFSDSLKEDLLKELDTYGYVLPEQLKNRVEELTQERAVNEAKIRELKAVLESRASGEFSAAGKDSESLSYMLATLTVRNVEIDYELNALTEANITAFAQILDREYERLEQAADTVQTVSAALYEQESRVTFASARIAVEGGMSAVVIGGGAGVLAFLAASVIIGYLAHEKASKGEKSAKEERAE